MIVTPESIDDVVSLVQSQFRTFGGTATGGSNPIALAMEGKPPQFAAGVSVREVVEFVANNLPKIKKSQKTKGR